MNKSGIILLILFGAIISSVIHAIIQKEIKGISKLKSLLFYFASYYFVFSVMKWLLGSSHNTLLQSFWDMEWLTYVHYGLPLLVMGIVAPFIVKLVFRQNGILLMEKFVSIIICLCFVAWLLNGQIGNAAYCICFASAFLLSLFLQLICKNGFVFIEKSEVKVNVKNLLPSVLLFTFMICIYYPNELYLTNVEEFFNSYWSFFVILLIGCVILTAFFIFAILLLPKNWIPIAAMFFFALSISGYIQAMFLNGELSALTGSEQTWSLGQLIINCLIWLVISVIILGIGIWKKSLQEIFGKIGIGLMLVLMITMVTLIVTTDTSANTRSKVFTNEAALEISDNDNVLIFILDLYDSTVMQDIIQENPQFVEPLHDFTYYRNATSAHGHTKLAIPYLLTGAEWRDNSEIEYRQYAYENTEFLDTLLANEFDLGIYTDISCVAQSQYGKISNYQAEVNRQSNVNETVSTMVQTSLYKMMPFMVKNSYSYYSSDISEMVQQGNIWSIDNDLYFYQKLKDDGLQINHNIKNAYRFYHMRGAHAPFYLSEDMKEDGTHREVSIYQQAKGSMKIVYEYLEQLKKLGKYDDATIIITADHGNVVMYDENTNRPEDTSMPIMFVKLPGQRMDELQISNAPVSQAEIFPTVLDSVGVQYEQFGRRFQDIGEMEERERFFIDTVDGWYEMRCSIRGDAQNLDNWNAVDVTMYR